MEALRNASRYGSESPRPAPVEIPSPLTREWAAPCSERALQENWFTATMQPTLQRAVYPKRCILSTPRQQ